MATALILAGCALWLGLQVPVNHARSGATANPLPDLHGHQAVEHLKQEGLYNTLAEAVAAARYNADPMPSPDAYRFSNPAQALRATFTSSGARFVSSKGRWDRELAIKLIGYGYGSRMTALDSRNIVARRNRIEHEYSVKESATRNPRSAIKEWFVNSEAGVEHGFTLPERPPTDRAGSEALRVEMEIGGDFEPQLDAAGQAVTLGCGCGADGLTYDKLRVYDARHREMAARFEREGKRLAIVVDDRQAEYPLTIDPLFAQQAKLTASDGAAEDRFGALVAISGNTAVVGAPYANTGGWGYQGAAYVFVRSGTTWTQQQKLTASDGAAYDYFGASVAISENTVVVGAINANSYQGAAYVFARSGTTWIQQQKLMASDAADFDQFGLSVAINGNTVAVGAPNADIGWNEEQGAAYIFARSGTTWTQQQKLTASEGLYGDYFGVSTALSQDTLVVGATGSNSYSFQGAAYVFARSGTIWTQQQKLMASDGTDSDFFGSSVAISGDTLVVGAYNANFGSNEGQGSAYVFVRSGTTWTQQQKLTASNGMAYNYFGASVAISGDTLAIGAPLANTGVYVFVRSGSTWNLQQEITASGGASVAISWNTLVVGAPGDFPKGAAYVFVR
jgi:hypothetical protein